MMIGFGATANYVMKAKPPCSADAHGLTHHVDSGDESQVATLPFRSTLSLCHVNSGDEETHDASFQLN